MPNRVRKTAKEKGVWAALGLVFYLSVGALIQDRVVSSANQYIGPWSELVFWAGWFIIAAFTVYGVRAAYSDVGLGDLISTRASAAGAKWSRFRQRTSKTKRKAMARRWVRLSDEILADMPRHDLGRTYLRSRDMPEEIRSALWQMETNQMVGNFEEGMNRARQRYLGRVTQARDEMRSIGITLEGRLGVREVFFVNTFCLQEWAGILGAEGRKILTEAGEEV